MFKSELLLGEEGITINSQHGSHPDWVCFSTTQYEGTIDRFGLLKVITIPYPETSSWGEP